MDTRIIIRQSMNLTPEEEIAEAIAPLLAEGFGVISATTFVAPHGAWGEGAIMGGKRMAFGSAMHVYYVTTVVMQKS